MITARIGSWSYVVYDNNVIVKTLTETKISPKPLMKDFLNKMIKKTETIFKKERVEHVVYKITPTSSVRNNQASVLAKVMSSFYRKPSERRTFFSESLVKMKDPYRMSMRIVMQHNDISFYLIVPREKAPEIIRKAEAIYDSAITIVEVPDLPKLDSSKVFGTELYYRKHDIFSLNTDKSNNYPLPSLLTAVRTLEENDIAVFDVMLEPSNPIEWYKQSKDAHKLLETGYVPTNSLSNKLLRSAHQMFDKLRFELLELTRFTKEQKEKLKEMGKEQSTYIEASRMRREMSNATKRKSGEDVLKTWLRVAVQSDDLSRARDAAYTIANAWKDISADNELEKHDIPKKWVPRFINGLETRTSFSIRLKPNIMSVDEVGKLLQLPGDSLLSEFPQIQSKKTKEVHLPDELNQKGKKVVRIGHVTERGNKKLATLPLEQFNDDIPLKAVYDAICTTTFGQGKQGSGKSEGFGTVWAYDMVMAGFTSILIDTADGQVLRNFVDSLPEDFPEEKIHVLNFDNKAYPIPLDWADIYGRNFGDDDELAAIEVSERITSRFIDFINSLSNTGEFTDRMAQYVTSCMRAITVRPGWSFLDLELALTSPAFREGLLKQGLVQKEPDIVRDLEDLQEKAALGKAGQIVDNIMNRLKVLSSTTFMANLFLQPPKLDEHNKPILDIRKLMDNKEGGYGHVIIIQASGIWEHNQATILGFMEDKINFNAFSRIDISQDERKPVLKWIDEPHKVIKRLEDRLAGTAVEFRKYRIKNLFTGHSIDQMGKAAKSLLEGGAQITSYKTESLDDLARFSHTFTPYEDAKELYAVLPEKHVAVNKVRLPSGKNCPAFIAEMVAPPKKVKDRSNVWHNSSLKYGRHWKEVKHQIQTKRNLYRELDMEWLNNKETEAREKVILDKKMKKDMEKTLKEA